MTKNCGECEWWREYKDNDHNRFGICDYKPVPFAANVLETMHDECEGCVCFSPPPHQHEGRVTVRDMTKFSTEELRSDLAETKADILVCRSTLKFGIETYSGGTVKHRLEVNEAIEVLIEEELSRRSQKEGE